MKLAFQLAYKNLIGAGIRTWLNVIILAFTFILILLINGIIAGWENQSVKDGVEWEYGYGHFNYNSFDPYDPFSFQDGHGTIPENTNNLTPILVRQASIYPKGRLIPIVLKGIKANQNILKIPTEFLGKNTADLPVLIGKNMAKANNLKEGDKILVRWKDKNNTFDAKNATIVDVFDTNISAVDNGQIWVSYENLSELTGLENQASYLVAGENSNITSLKNWNFKSQNDLLANLYKTIQLEKVNDAVVYIILLFIALLAVFDTQVLSIFRRQKEIGTYVALGMTRKQVRVIFTVEGIMYSIFAIITGAIIGAPLFYYLAKTGLSFNNLGQNMGFEMPKTIYSLYSPILILGTVALLILSTTIVSYIPAKKIAKMDPVKALKGKMQ